MAEQLNKLVHAQYLDKQSLYNCYMNFCKDGGLFIPGSLLKIQPHLGQNLNLLIEIPADHGLYPVSGKVSWINLNKRKGVGVRLSPDDFSRSLKAAIENTLGGMVNSVNPTYTM